MEQARCCLISPLPGRADQVRNALAHSDGRAGLVYETCDPDTCLTNLHRYQPNVFILDLDLGRDAVSRLVSALQRAGFPSCVFLGTPQGDSSLPGEAVPIEAPVGSLLSAIYRVSAPQSPSPAPETSDPAGRNRKVCIAVHSPKGGTGKTLVACSLARQYAARGLKTLLVDLGMYGGVSPAFGFARRESAIDEMIDRLTQRSGNELSTVTVRTRELCLRFPADDHVLHLLPAASPLKMAKLGLEHAEALLSSILAESFEVVIVDTSSEVSERTMVALKHADYVLLVVTPDLPAVWSVLSMRDLLANLNVGGNLQVVLNRSTEGPHLGRELEEVLGYPVVAQIPEMRSPWQRAVERSLAFDYSVAGMALKRLAHHFYPLYGPVEFPVGKR